MKTHIGDAPDQRGSLVACTGAKWKIIGLEVTKSKAKDGKVAKKMYVLEVEGVEPKEIKGAHVRDWIVVGTEDDPKAKEKATWQRSEAGPGRIARLFTKAGVDAPADDEEWDGVLSDCEIIAPLTASEDDEGQVRNRLGLFFAESDDDCPEIGVAEEGGGKGKKKGKGAAAANKKARKGKGAEDDEDEDEDEEDEEDEPKSKKKGKKSSKKDDDEDEEEEEEEEDEDEKPKKGKKGKKSSKKKDEDEDEDEE